MGRAGSQGRARPTGGPCVLPSSPSRDDWSDGCSDGELGGALGGTVEEEAGPKPADP